MMYEQWFNLTCGDEDQGRSRSRVESSRYQKSDLESQAPNPVRKPAAEIANAVDRVSD